MNYSFKIGSSVTRGLISLHLASNHRKKNDIQCITEVWSCAFSVIQATGCSALSMILILFLSLCQCSLSGRLKCVPSDSCLFQRGDD